MNIDEQPIARWSPRLDLGQRPDQVRRRLAFARGEPLHFVQEFGVGEARERVVRRHAPVYHDVFRPTTMAVDGRSVAGEAFLWERGEFVAVKSSVYAACGVRSDVRGVLAESCQAGN